jgi:hypothetical protein
VALSAVGVRFRLQATVSDSRQPGTSMANGSHVVPSAIRKIAAGHPRAPARPFVPQHCAGQGVYLCSGVKMTL